VVTEEMTAFMLELRKHVNIGIVGGSDLTKIKEQLGEDCALLSLRRQPAHRPPAQPAVRPQASAASTGPSARTASRPSRATRRSARLCAPNRRLPRRHASLTCCTCQSIRTHFSDDQLKELINFALHYFADLDIPVKRGTFVEFRSGMLNMSPIGRNCSQEERDAFEEYDKEAKVRETMVGIMREKFAHMDLTCAPTCPCCCCCCACCWPVSTAGRAGGAAPLLRKLPARVGRGAREWSRLPPPRPQPPNLA